MPPLDGVLVLDLTTLLPGPLATLWMREAGARVVKIERPPDGDEMRAYEPRFGQTSVNFALLNSGKASLALDLKDPTDRVRLDPLLREADVLVEQFRPGVMARLGLDYARVHEINPRLVYCSITGYGQEAARSAVAAHDLNFIAETGLLSLVEPRVPPILVADIGGGSYPALVNVLLALRERDRTGTGMWIDVAMAHNLFPWMYWAIGNGLGTGRWPRASGELVTGGSPRYALYRAADGRIVAAAPLEDRFWRSFCDLLGLDAEALDALAPAEAHARVAERVAAEPSDHWRHVFAEHDDICCNVVNTLEEALSDPAFRERGIFDRTLRAGEASMPALPSPIVRALRTDADEHVARRSDDHGQGQ